MLLYDYSSWLLGWVAGLSEAGLLGRFAYPRFGLAAGDDMGKDNQDLGILHND
jgi:hypothetical protein